MSSAASGKCPTCTKTAYPAESLSWEGKMYHKACFKCIECAVRLTLTTVKVSDFHGDSIYCNKCVPKQAPSQSEASMELERAGRASKLVQDVRLVNEQVRGAEETLGKPTHAIPK